VAFSNVISDAARASFADAVASPYWLDRPDRPEPRPRLEAPITADLLVVGAGFSGLWTAYEAAMRHPDLDIVLVDGGRVGYAASGRNGGFVSASLTHGIANGMTRWPQDMPELQRLGQDNLEAIAATVVAEDIDCDFIRSGEISVAVEDYQIDDLQQTRDLARSIGVELDLLSGEQVRHALQSPTYLAGLKDNHGVAMVDPARLAWGLAAACERRGVRIYEHTPVRTLGRIGAGILAGTDHGRIRAGRVALATSAYPPLLSRLGHFIIAVYDSVLMSEPLSAQQRDMIGWQGREGFADSGNQFHYYRITEDARILWGGYDASYYGDMGPHREDNPDAYGRLAEHFFATFPQLEGLKFTHRWSGAIDTCSRFSAFWGTAMGGRVSYSVGFTGLGVGASRFGAEVMLDLLWGEDTERTRLSMTRTKPIPFPPRPLRDAAIGVTRWSINRADEHAGKRNLWLRTLDRMGLGFDS
jgi:glycine/D-amino acid oxidase-like deaminating enzyme